MKPIFDIMKNNDKSEVAEVFEGTAWQAGMVKNLLENEGIEAFLNNEILGNRFPWTTAPGGVKVMVSNTDFEKAKEIVEEYERNMRENG